MGIPEVYQRIASVTTRWDFTAPVEAVDLETVQNALAEALPGYPASVTPMGSRVLVQVFELGGRRIYAREMLVVTQPQTS